MPDVKESPVSITRDSSYKAPFPSVEPSITNTSSLDTPLLSAKNSKNDFKSVPNLNSPLRSVASSTVQLQSIHIGDGTSHNQFGSSISNLNNPRSIERHQTYLKFPIGRSVTVLPTVRTQLHGLHMVPRHENSYIKTAEKYEGLYDALDQTAPEVIAAKREPQNLIVELAFKLFKRGKSNHIPSYYHLRDIYRIQHREKRNPTISNGFIARCRALIPSRNVFANFVLGGRVIIVLSIIELLRDLTFCVVYLGELQLAATKSVGHELTPEWLYTPRALPTFRIIWFLSAFSLFSLIFNIFLVIMFMTKVDNSTRILRLPLNILVSLLSLICLALPWIPNGQLLCIPPYN